MEIKISSITLTRSSTLMELPSSIGQTMFLHDQICADSQARGQSAMAFFIFVFPLSAILIICDFFDYALFMRKRRRVRRVHANCHQSHPQHQRPSEFISHVTLSSVCNHNNNNRSSSSRLFCKKNKKIDEIHLADRTRVGNFFFAYFNQRSSRWGSFYFQQCSRIIDSEYYELILSSEAVKWGPTEWSAVTTDDKALLPKIRRPFTFHPN